MTGGIEGLYHTELEYLDRGWSRSRYLKKDPLCGVGDVMGEAFLGIC